MPKVQIIVPVYNPPEKLFRDCLRSIAAQEHADFSCVLVDDGSNPDIAAICDETAACDSRFRVIHKQNEGTACARRDGSLAALAAGAEFVVYFDSDDTADTKYISTLLGKLLETNADACFCGMNHVCVGNTAAFDWDPSPAECGTSDDHRGILQSCFEIPHKRFGFRGVLWAGIYRAFLLDGVDWEFTKVKLGQDARLSLQLMLNVKKAAYCHEKLYNYVQHGSSAVRIPNLLAWRGYTIPNLFAMADCIKNRFPEFDFTDYCARVEACEYDRLLEERLKSGADRRILRDEIRECVRHIRHAMKYPGALSWCASRRRRVGLRVLDNAGLHVYFAYRFLAKTESYPEKK